MLCKLRGICDRKLKKEKEKENPLELVMHSQELRRLSPNQF